MEKMNVELNNGEIAFVGENVNMIMNIDTLLELLNKLKNNTPTCEKTRAQDKDIKRECNCNCNCKNNKANDDKYAGYYRLLKALVDDENKNENVEDAVSTESTDSTDSNQDLSKTLNNLANEITEYLNKVIDEMYVNTNENDVNGCFDDEDEDDDEDEEFNMDDELEDDDILTLLEIDDEDVNKEKEEEVDNEFEQECPPCPSCSQGYITVRFNPSYMNDFEVYKVDDWRNGLEDILGEYESLDEAAAAAGVKDLNLAMNNCMTWESIGELLDNRIINNINYDYRAAVIDYAKDMLNKDIDLVLYCTPRGENYNFKKRVVFMRDDTYYKLFADKH